MVKKSNIEFIETPDQEEISLLVRKIAQETPHPGVRTPFGFFIKEDDNQTIAGVTGNILYGAIYTDLLWVDKAHRQQGLGRELMEAVHKHGIHHQCNMATVETMNFLGAVDFYRKLGYTEDFVRPGYKKGSKRLFMRKILGEQ